jgi:hypothetical protein
VVGAVEVVQNHPGEEWEERGGRRGHINGALRAMMGVQVCGGTGVEDGDRVVNEEGFEDTPSPVKDIRAPGRAPCVDVSHQE